MQTEMSDWFWLVYLAFWILINVVTDPIHLPKVNGVLGEFNKFPSDFSSCPSQQDFQEECPLPSVNLNTNSLDFHLRYLWLVRHQ